MSAVAEAAPLERRVSPRRQRGRALRRAAVYSRELSSNPGVVYIRTVFSSPLCPRSARLLGIRFQTVVPIEGRRRVCMKVLRAGLGLVVLLSLPVAAYAQDRGFFRPTVGAVVGSGPGADFSGAIGING